jgi:hypothetical protein
VYTAQQSNYSTTLHVALKVKFSLCRLWRPSGLRKVEAPAFSDIRLIDGCKVALNDYLSSQSYSVEFTFTENDKIL